MVNSANTFDRRGYGENDCISQVIFVIGKTSCNKIWYHQVPTEKSEKLSGTNKIIDNLRGLIGLHHFYTVLISFIRKALYNDIGKCSNVKAEIYDFFLNLKLKVDVISNMYVDHLNQHFYFTEFIF